MCRAEKRRGEGRGGAEPVQGLTGQQREGGCVHWGSALDRGGRGDVLMGGGLSISKAGVAGARGPGESGGCGPGTDSGSGSRQALQAIVRTWIYFKREREPHGRVLRGECGLCLLGWL